MRYERSEYLRADNDIFTDGPPGIFRRLTSSAPLVDPSCGTFGNDQNDKGQFDNFPSGIKLASGARCGIFFGQWIQYNRPSEPFTGYVNMTHQTTDWLELEYQGVFDSNLSVFITEASSPMNSARSTSMVIPANHPANPFGSAVIPVAFRTFNGRSNSPQPSYLEHGSQWDDSTFLSDRHAFSARYELGGDWSGQTSLSHQTRRFRYKTYRVRGTNPRLFVDIGCGSLREVRRSEFAGYDTESSYALGSTSYISDPRILGRGIPCASCEPSRCDQFQHVLKRA